jgi:hypothetical protein
MKSLKMFLSIVIVYSVISCADNSNVRKEGNADNKINSEDVAVTRITDSIYSKKTIYENKKLAIYHFSNLQGKETEEGQRLSKSFLNVILQKGGLRFIERAELDKLLEAQSIELTGITDADSSDKTGKVQSIDAIVTGTIAQVSDYGELSVKVVDIQSGEIYAFAIEKFLPIRKFSYQESSDKLKLYQQNPQILDRIQNVYNNLMLISKKAPVIFLISVMEDSELANVRRPALAKRINLRYSEIKSNPAKNRNVLHRREVVKEMQQQDLGKFNELMAIKDEILKGRK